jgi:DNA gyrase/topoisomerase IV, subunit A
MGDRSGVGLVECAILEALDSPGARPRRHRRSAKVLERVEERIGLAPGYAYEVLVDLARPWKMPLLLVDGQGNFGSRGNDPAANYRYTDAGLTRAGEAVLAAERGELAPVPVGLINGNVYREGLRPPFRPLAIIEALREVIRRPRATGKDLISIIGPPCFLNGCTVTGDFAALAAGRLTILRLEARVRVSDDHGSVLIVFTGVRTCRSGMFATSPRRHETLTCWSVFPRAGPRRSSCASSSWMSTACTPPSARRCPARCRPC